MTDFDVIVVGAGIEGSATAWRLTQRRKKVLLIDQFPLPHSRGSSHGQSRQIRHLYSDKLMFDLVRESYKGWAELEQLGGVQLFRKTGSFLTGSKSHPELVKCKKLFAGTSVNHRILSSQQFRREYPVFNFPDDYEAIFDAEGGLLFPDKSLQILWQQIRQNGGKILDHTKLISIDSKATGSVSITTSNGKFISRAAVLCLGAWTKPIVKQNFGVDLILEVHLINYYYARDPQNAYAADKGMPTMNMIDTDGVFFYAWPAYEYSGMIKIGIHGGVPGDPDLPDAADHSKMKAKTLAFLGKRWPHVEKNFSVTEQCIYTWSKNEDFILSRLPNTSVVVGAGFSGHGFKFAPVVGSILADLATGEKVIFDIERFDVRNHVEKPSKL